MQNLAIRSGGQPVRLGAWRRHDRELCRLFSGPTAGDEATYGWVFRYLLTGFLEWRTADGARAAYPGLASSHGADADLMEGFSRFAPVMAAWLAGGRPRLVETLDGRRVDLAALLAEGFLAGTDPASSGYWGICAPRD